MWEEVKKEGQSEVQINLGDQLSTGVNDLLCIIKMLLYKRGVPSYTGMNINLSGIPGHTIREANFGISNSKLKRT